MQATVLTVIGRMTFKKTSTSSVTNVLFCLKRQKHYRKLNYIIIQEEM